MFEVIHQVQGLYKIIKLKEFRKTPGVSFDIITSALLPTIDCIDKVIHQPYAFSPRMINNTTQPWFMHPFQDDHLLVLHGEKEIELFSPIHSAIVTFVVTPHKIFKDGQLLYEGDVLLMWPKEVFHRVISKENGSASINLAVRHKGFTDHNNFNIYEVDTINKKFKIIKESHPI